MLTNQPWTDGGRFKPVLVQPFRHACDTAYRDSIVGPLNNRLIRTFSPDANVTVIQLCQPLRFQNAIEVCNAFEALILVTSISTLYW